MFGGLVRYETRILDPEASQLYVDSRCLRTRPSHSIQQAIPTVN